MSNSIQSQITNMQSYTNIQKAQEQAINGASKEMGQDAFLLLMMEQLKYQDPLAPVGNTEFLAQQAAFTQVSELQKLNDAMSVNSQVTQACSLIGKMVAMTDPNDATKFIEGEVSAVTFSGGSAQLVINGSEYPMNNLLAVTEMPTSNNDTNTENNS